MAPVPSASARSRTRRPGRPGRPDNLAGWLAYAQGLHPQSVDMSLARVTAVRDALGLAPSFAVITVAGTNGKGSTCALLESVLRAAGHLVGVYTSPHLLRYNERVRIDGVSAGDAVLAAGFARVDAARGSTLLTPFEFGTLAAMCVFVEAGLDAAILEVGLGGRLDAVNAFDADCAIITSIGIDHTEYLGHTREAIGLEKAGVFRPKRTAISADPDPPPTIAQYAWRIGARLLQNGRDYWVRQSGDEWALVHPGGEICGLPLPALAGDFQLDNAAAALLALHTLSARLALDAPHRHAGLRGVRLAGRFQRWRQSATSPEVVLDVAHNPHAAERLADLLVQHPVRGRTFAVFAMLRDKDIAATARALDAHIDAWFVCGLAERRGASADDMALALAGAEVRAEVRLCSDPCEALRMALAQAKPDDRVLVFGSFSTVGAVLPWLDRPSSLAVVR